jgi:hypothetical protein
VPGYLLHDVLTPFGGQLWFSGRRWAVLSRFCAARYSAHADLRWFPACEGEEPNRRRL